MTLTLHTDPLPLRVDESGSVRVGGTRVTLDTLVAAFQQGDSPETLAASFDTLQLADIYAVIGYYLRHRAEVDAYLAERARQAEELRRQHPGVFVDWADVRERLRARLQGGTAADAPLHRG